MRSSNRVKKNLEDFFKNEIQPKKVECIMNNNSLSCSYQEFEDVKKNQNIDEIVSYIHIDSSQRDTEEYPNPSYYNIYLHKEYQSIKSIHLRSIEFHDPPTPINKTNNIFYWITDYSGFDPSITTRVEYTLTMPKNYYTYQSFIKTFEKISNLIRHKIPSIPAIHNKFPIFDMFIDNSTKKLQIIQRLEKLAIISIRTMINTNIIEIEVEDTSGQPFDSVHENVPIILTGLELYYTDYGGIHESLITNIPFFKKDSILRFKSIINTHNYYELKSNIGSLYTYRLYVHTPDEEKALASKSIHYTNISDEKTLYNLPTRSYVGRALSFEIIGGKEKIEENCGYSTENNINFGTYLGLQTENMNVYIQTNMNYELQEVKNKIPWKVVAFEELSLSIDDYIFLRIGTSSQPKDKISNNLVCAKGCFKNTLLVNDKENFFFAKILFTDRVPGDITINYVAGNKIFYQETIDKMSDISIEFYNKYGELLDLDQNNSLTLEIVETRTLLQGTYHNSQTGN